MNPKRTFLIMCCVFGISAVIIGSAIHDKFVETFGIIFIVLGFTVWSGLTIIEWKYR
jgi:arginine exporter protein ArgO